MPDLELQWRVTFLVISWTRGVDEKEDQKINEVWDAYPIFIFRDLVSRHPTANLMSMGGIGSG